MRFFICFFLAAFSLSACSFFSSPPATEGQMSYVKEAIICDSKTPEYSIVGFDEIEFGDFFSGESENDELVIEYKYQDNVLKTGKITFKRSVDDQGNIYFKSDFETVTLPFSECRNVKREPHYF